MVYRSNFPCRHGDTDAVAAQFGLLFDREILANSTSSPTRCLLIYSKYPSSVPARVLFIVLRVLPLSAAATAATSTRVSAPSVLRSVPWGKYFSATVDGRARCLIPKDWVQAGDFTFRARLAAGEALLSLPARPSAIFAANDELALGVLVSALRMNVTVSRDLSVAGFDNAQISRMAWPKLTTVQQPNKQMASAAIDILVDPRYESLPAQSFSRNMPYELIIRDSTGPWPG